MKYPDDFVNKIICGDCLEVMKKMPDGCVDAIISDPPFGIGFSYKEKEMNNNPKDYWAWLAPIYKEMMRTLKHGGFYAIWQTHLYFRYFWKWFGGDVHIYAGCKNFVQLRKTAINYGFDPIIIGYKEGNLLKPKKPKRNIDFFVANTAKYVAQKNSLARQHPCPRPIDQAIELIDNFTIEEGLIFDPFIGSGTTAIACKKLHRNFIGIEINPDYCKIAEERLAQGVL